MANAMRAVALVPAHNEAGTIIDCIEAIQASTHPISEITVVADAGWTNPSR
jgi:glycosyltransferase involved in cell wall biosynthesis